MNKKVFTVKIDGVDVELSIKKPTASIRIDAKLIYNKMWKQAVDSGSMLRRNIEKEAEKLGLWNDSSRQEVEDTAEQLRSLERKLRGEAKNFSSKDEAKACALEMRRLRSKLLELNHGKDELYVYTAESFADDAMMKYFVSQCCVDNNTGKPYFKNYEDFLLQSETEVAREAVNNYYELIYSDVEDIPTSWQENIFLKKYRFVDDKLRLIDKSGRLVDEDGRLLDESGRYVNENNEYIDRQGNLVDKEGSYIVDYEEFV